MGYKVLADKFEMDEMRVKYGPRKGLEGLREPQEKQLKYLLYPR